VRAENVPILIQTGYLERMETIFATLHKKAEQLGLILPSDVAFYIAKNVPSNAHALELALIRLTAYSSLTGTQITLACTQRVLKNFIDAQERKVPVDFLQIQNPPFQQFDTKQAKIKRQDSTAADRHFVFCQVRAREGRTIRARQESEVNKREVERERLARWDAYERALERRRAKRRNQA
jgi:hypothetical protein